MNLVQLLLVVVAVFIFGSILIHFQHGQTLCDEDPNDHRDMAKLMKLVYAQNETIYTLERHLNDKHQDLTQMSKEYQKLIELSEQVTHLSSNSLNKDETPAAKDCPKAEVSNSDTTYTHPWKLTSMEQDCENRYGMDLVHIWKKNKQSWCGSPEEESELICYPYHQTHKKLDGRGPDLFCEARNFVIDFSKVHGEHGAHKPSLGSQYLSFERGSLTSSCKTTSQFQSRMFMPHHSIQVCDS